ncbi:hypothetical protein ACFQ88_36050 [Paenibacillus sp. NPDC056579]|uniref:hypothetical protein n=1 Tax=Paenibacillus sp. NPDC056579 TaxID=3345871 RepID=UPI00369F837A
MNQTKDLQRAVELLYKSKDISHKILQLSFHEDTFIEELNDLQQRQEIVRAELQRLFLINSALLGDEIKALAADCLQVEEQVKTKLTNFQSQIQREFQQFKQKSNIMKNNYGTYVQASGYFIDRHID